MSKGDNFANGALVTRVGNAKKSSEELNGISESAQEQHEMELQALFDQLELEEGEEVQFPYLVRGAELYCNCGTHKRRLNLPMGTSIRLYPTRGGETSGSFPPGRGVI